MSREHEVRIVVGFDGGQGVDIETTEKAWTELRRQLESEGTGWISLPGRDDTEYHLSLAKISWVRHAAMARAIGFHD